MPCFNYVRNVILYVGNAIGLFLLQSACHMFSFYDRQNYVERLQNGRRTVNVLMYYIFSLSISAGWLNDETARSITKCQFSLPSC